jgi:hypothetical protein
LILGKNIIIAKLFLFVAIPSICKVNLSLRINSACELKNESWLIFNEIGLMILEAEYVQLSPYFKDCE